MARQSLSSWSTWSGGYREVPKVIAVGCGTLSEACKGGS